MVEIMTQVYDYARDFVTAIAGDPSLAVMDWRAIHDTDKGVPAKIHRGTLDQCWAWLVQLNDQGYGIFATISSMDGEGRELHNVSYVRAHFVDLDNASALQSYMTARESNPTPCFGVQSSHGKFHVYWTVRPYLDNERFTTIQRKLVTAFGGDKKIIDSTRVMRVPGFYHLKDPHNPYLTVCERLNGFGGYHEPETLETALQHIVVDETHVGSRHDLGDPTLAAPSLVDLAEALSYVNPNTLDRSQWIAMTAAIKQSGWTLTDPDTLRNIWMQWCAQYEYNDEAENLKQWNSLRNTQLGWKNIVARVPQMLAKKWFSPVTVDMPPMPTSDQDDDGFDSEFLTGDEQIKYFKGCVFVVNLGQILAPDGRLLNASAFNAVYGGKYFIINSQGKHTDEAWKAVTRNTLWQIPKVDHLRFLPHQPFRSVTEDDVGRKGVNVYKPANIVRMTGDSSPFHRHMEKLIGDPNDLKTIYDWIAHNIKYPGHKIPWACVIQSTEGAGKGVMKRLMTHAIGRSYIYFPNAKELTNSGSQFNGWMRNKLFILADEIKVDDRRDLIEVLKPMISEELIEVQSKGVDQGMEDNFSNWLFFTNWRDAIPITKNGRRFSVFYSPLQTASDLVSAGMDNEYFTNLYNWLNDCGNAIVTDWFMNYPIERGRIPMRAPHTASTDAAIESTRSPVEQVIMDAVEEKIPGFMGGWVSVQSVVKRVKALGAVRGNLTPQTVQTVLEMLGYVNCGRAEKAYFQEDASGRSLLYNIAGKTPVSGFGQLQGWE